MARCLFPACQQEAVVTGARPDACLRHQGTICYYSNVQINGVPVCDEPVITNSAWCLAHNESVAMWDYLHQLRHQEAANKMIELQKQEAVVKQIYGPNGKLGTPWPRR